MDDVQPNDILFGRGPFCYMNPGNRIFREKIRSYSTLYERNTPRELKREIVESLTKLLQAQGHRFLVHSSTSGIWREADPNLVHAKIGHALRDVRNSVAKQSSSSELSSPHLREHQSMSHTIAKENIKRIGFHLGDLGKGAAVSGKGIRKRRFRYTSQCQSFYNIQRTQERLGEKMISSEVKHQTQDFRLTRNFQR
jgi:hypothetical protein